MGKKTNIIFILFIIIVIIAFLIGFSVAKNQSNISQNQNVTISLDPGTKEHKKIDINNADKNELMSIEGIGDKKAQLIIDNRPYNSIWDLSNNGISEDFIKGIESEVTIDAKS